MVGIYKITSPLGKVYIGQSWDIENRQRQYKNDRAKGQPYLHNSIIKYSWNTHTFEIIHELQETITQEELNYWETFYWQKCKDGGLELLNVKEPGSNGKHSVESKRKIGEASKGNKNCLGRKLSDESKRKISEALKGKTLTEEHKRKISETNGNMSEETKRKLSEAGKGNKNSSGHKHSEESKRKMSEAKKGKTYSKDIAGK